MSRNDPRFARVQALVMETTGQNLKNQAVVKNIEAGGARLRQGSETEQGERQKVYLQKHGQKAQRLADERSDDDDHWRQVDGDEMPINYDNIIF